jgi:hypothetical protein
MKMPRETKAQRIARQEQEQLLREQELANTYQERLMDTLGAATKEGCFLGVRDGKFVVNGWNDTFELGLEWNWKNDYVLSDLQFQISMAENARAEAERQALVRANALQKLTTEERDLLGL